MAIVEQTSAGGTVAGDGRQSWIRANWGLLLAVAVLTVILLLPTPADLPVAAHRMLAILGFAVIIWMTEAIDYAVSAVVIAALMAFLLGLAPSVANPKVLMGTSAALGLAFSGFANTALVLVAAALFLAAAMTATGLDKRIALTILSRAGTETRNVVIGTILVGFVIALMVPSTTARVACLVPITLGIIAAFGVDRRGAFAGMLMITTVQTASIWNVGIKTAAAQNMVAIGFIEKAFGRTITWLDWLIAAGPFAVLMCVALYFVMTRMMPAEVAQVPGGREGIRKSLSELGPMKPSEIKLLLLSITLIGFWATEGVLHKFDTSTTTITAVALMFLPGFGIMTLEGGAAQDPVGHDRSVRRRYQPWYGAATDHGGDMARQHRRRCVWSEERDGALYPRRDEPVSGRDPSWLRQRHGAGIGHDPDRHRRPQERSNARHQRIGMTMLLQFVVSFGFILVVNAPQNMVAYGTDTFSARDFVRTGLVLTVIALALVMLLAATYWRWLGYV